MSVGQSLPRVDAVSKVTGKAVYAADFIVPGLLAAQVLRSPLPHARIINIDTSLAAKIPGVFAVITGKDLPDRRYGHRLADYTALARDRVRYVGEGVAAVAAASIDAAREALDSIRVEYEELPAVTDPLLAMATGAPVIHPDLRQYTGFPGGIEQPNVCSRTICTAGNVEEGLTKADFIFTDTFRTPMVHQGYIEPHTCTVQISPDGAVKVWSSAKSPFGLRGMLAQYLGLPVGQVEVIFGSVGGDFGGKGLMLIEPICYYLARKSAHPVRLVYTAQEELIAINPRHASIITIKSGVTSDGRITARKVEVIFDAGAYAAANSNISVSGDRKSAGIYRIPHCRIDGYAVYTNNIPAGHCRAPGDPQAFFAVETHTDLLASRLGINPYQFRRINCLQEGDVSPIGLQWQNLNALETLELAVTNSDWGKPKPSPYTGRGMALTERPVGFGYTEVTLSMHNDGSATVVTGTTEAGAGSRTILCQIAAQELQIPVSHVFVTEGHTGLGYDDGSGNSRTTNVAGHAVRLAAQDLLNKLQRQAAGKLQCLPEDLVYEASAFTASTGQRLVMSELLKNSKQVSGHGVFAYPPGKNAATCFAAQVAEVKVDPATGTVTVLKVVGAHDIGLAINPMAVKGQIEGSIVQGLGYALNEELVATGGQPRILSLADYKMATTMEAPAIDCYLLEDRRGPGPYGAKSIGEQAIAATAPAIANAIFDAIGIRITELPITPEKIYQALQAKAKVKGENTDEI